MKLTKEQRQYMLNEIIDHDMEQLYKPRDMYYAFYEGITPYKDLTDEEIIEYYDDWGEDIPTNEYIKSRIKQG